MRSPIKWLGGKGRLARRICALMPAHRVFVDVFGGGGAVLLAHTPPQAGEGLEVYNDRDEGLCNLFRVLRDPELFLQFQQWIELIPYSRAEWQLAKDQWESTSDPVLRAVRWYLCSRQGFGGFFARSWGFEVSAHSRGTHSYLAAVQGLPQVSARLRLVQVDCLDWRVCLDRYDGPDALFYLDPPYVPDTRRDGEYGCELTLEDHAELVARLLGGPIVNAAELGLPDARYKPLEGKAILSGYSHEVYKPLEAAGWQRVDTKTVCNAVGRTRTSGYRGAGAYKGRQDRTECLWISPSSQVQRVLPGVLG